MRPFFCTVTQLVMVVLLLRRPFTPEKELKRTHCTAWAKFIHFANNGSLLSPSFPLSLPVCCERGWLVVPRLSLRADGVAQTLTNTKVAERQSRQRPAPHRGRHTSTGSTATKTTTITKFGKTKKKKGHCLFVWSPPPLSP